MAVTIPEGQVYLDNASTTFPKPPQVEEAVAKAVRTVGLTTGRGTYFCEINPDDVVANVRRKIVKLFNADNPQRVIFTYSATDSISTVFFGMLEQGDHVLVSPLEHHAVSRALHHLREWRGVEHTAMPADENGCIIPERISEVVRPHTRLACVSHISNVGGTVQPMADIGEELRRLDIPLMIDASQSAGCHEVDVKKMNLDILAAPGHKSLLGLPGSGLLYLSERINPRPIRVGGTGSYSERYTLPPELPTFYESGTPNVLGIIALDAALDFIAGETVQKIERRHHELSAKMLDGLRARQRVSIVGPADPKLRAPVISFNIEGMTPQEASKVLADRYHIANRGGLHCAPMAHEFFGSDKLGGAVRVSPGYLTPEWEIEYFFSALDEILAS